MVAAFVVDVVRDAKIHVCTLYTLHYARFRTSNPSTADTASKNRHVTCGSVIKLLNTDYRVRLHSHDVKYGTGSGQQSVTGTELQEDANSHWTVMGDLTSHCERG